ncbi:T9SS type A sorting domain-containing protein [bacterium]|nr:T9SS type A sorting domain-containing protein [bacterium]
MTASRLVFRASLLMVVALVLIFGYFLIVPEKKPSLEEALAQLPDPDQLKMTIGEEEDSPMSRKEFDWIRLHDPKTGQIPRGMRTRELAYARSLPVRGSALKQNESMIATQDWQARGPWNIGGRTRALAVDVANTDRVIAGGVTGGLWISEDAGDTWSMTTEITDMPGITCIAQDRREGHTDTWYYGTGEYTGSGSRSINSRIPTYTGDGIFKSTDGGETWTLLESTSALVNFFDSPFDVVFKVAVNPANLEQEEVWAATYGSIHRSLDGGETWEMMLGSPNTVPSAWTDVIITDDGTVWATLASECVNGGIWKKVAGDETFDNVTPAGWGQDWDRVVTAYFQADNELVYVIGQTPGSGFENQYSLWMYDNREGQDEWTDLSVNMPDFRGEANLGFGAIYAAQGGYNMTVAIHPTLEDVVYIGGTSLFRSMDGFTTQNNQHWIGGYNYYYGELPGEDGEDISYPNHHADVHNLVFNPDDPTVFYSSHDGGLSKTTEPLYIPGDEDPFPWQYIEGYVTTQFYWVALDPLTPGSEAFQGGMQDNGTWITGGENFEDPWYNIYGGDGMACECGAAEDPDHRSWYATTQYGGTFLRIVLDENFEFVDFDWFNPGGNLVRWITPLRLAPDDSRIMILVDENSARICEDVVADPDFHEIQGSEVQGWLTTAVDISAEIEGQRVAYYGAYNPNTLDISRIYRIEDPLGDNPVVTNVTDPLTFPQGGWLHDISIDPTNPNVALATFTNYNIPSLLYTEDGGTTWRDVGGNLEENPDGSGAGPSCFWSELTYVNDEPFVLVGTTIGLFSTTDLDAEEIVWEQEGADVLGNVWVTTMDVRHEDGFIAIGTHGRGTYSAFLSTVSVNPEPTLGTPNEYTLKPAYPNPFNAATTVTVALPERADLTVEIFDIQGRRVQKLASGNYQAGDHRFSLNGSRLASGVYFVRATVPGKMDAQQRVVLVK